MFFPPFYGETKIGCQIYTRETLPHMRVVKNVKSNEKTDHSGHTRQDAAVTVLLCSNALGKDSAEGLIVILCRDLALSRPG